VSKRLSLLAAFWLYTTYICFAVWQNESAKGVVIKVDGREKTGAFIVERNFVKLSQAMPYRPERGFGFVMGINRKESYLIYPETNGGFVPQWWYDGKKLTDIVFTEYGCTWDPTDAVLKADLEGRCLPLCYRLDVPRRGSYRLTLTLWAEEDAEEVLVYVGRRRLAWRGSIPAGERVEVTAVCDVSPIIPRGQSDLIDDLGVCFSLLSGSGKLFLQSARLEAISACTVYIMGDSTVTDQTAGYPYAPGVSYGGWGQMLGMFLPDGYCVSNHAHSGLTTESFRSEGHWAVMSQLVKAGDLCLIQFGHNDQKLALLQPDEGYTERLERYIGELRALGARPVLVTPLARNSWNNPEQYNDLLEAYAEAVFRVGERLNVPVLDLHRYAIDEIKAVGLEGAKPWFYPSDYTHTNDYGAYKMASYVGRSLCALLGEEVKGQSDWEPRAPLTALMPPEDCDMIPPTGVGDAMKAFEEEQPEAPIKRVECLELVIQKMRFFPINVYNDMYDDVLGHETYAGTVQCAAQNHLIPPVFVADGKLYPNKPVSLQDFLAVLMPAYASRKKLQKTETAPEDVADYAKEAVKMALGEGLVEGNAEWNALLTRKQAVELCRSVRI